jgi:hypothetical protein
LRRRNALQAGDTNGAGVVLHTSTGIAACLSMLQAHALWRERLAWQAAAPEGKRRGVGLAAVFNAAGYGGKVRDAAIAKVELTPQGQIVVHNAVSDMGQGNASAFVQMAGHVLTETPAGERATRHGQRLPSGSSSAGDLTPWQRADRACPSYASSSSTERTCCCSPTTTAHWCWRRTGCCIHGHDVTLGGGSCAPRNGAWAVSGEPRCGSATGMPWGFRMRSLPTRRTWRVESMLTGQVAVRDYLSVTDGARSSTR